MVVEGYFDRIALALAGVAEAVATCGTSLTREHARQLRRRTREVVLLFDGDAAGERALERALEVLLPEGLRVRAGVLPAGADPADVLEREGPEALGKVVADAPPAFSFLIGRAATRGAEHPWEKADAVGGVIRQLAAVQNPVERGEFARQLALAVDARVEDVDAALRSELRERGAPDDEPVVVRPRRDGPEARNARHLARIWLERPGLAARLDLADVAALSAEAPWDTLLPALCSAARDAGGERFDVHALAETLGEDARSELAALAVESDQVDADAAERAAGDLLRWFRRRRADQTARGTTRQFRADPATDPDEILATKQRQIEERRRAQGLPPGPARGGPRP